MIYDFGFLGKPGLEQVLPAFCGAVATLVEVAGLSVIAVLPRRDARFQAQDIFVGWGVVATVMTLAGVLFAHVLPFVALALFVLMAIAAVPALKSHYFYAPFWLVALFPGLFVLTSINLAGIAAWDDFAQWVPNALYLFQYDSLPGPSLPPSHSLFPGYPYAVPFLTYMASWLAGGFLVQGGAMMAFLLLTAFASMLAEIPAPTDNSHPLNRVATCRLALALLLVTVANPGFDTRYANTGDVPTMVLTGALGLMLWRVSQHKNAPSMTTISSIALTAIALALTKQSNIVLLVLLSGAFLIVAAKNKILKVTLPAVLQMVVPALLLRLVWQHYVNFKMSGNGFSFHPLSAWRFDLMQPLLQAIGKTTLNTHGFSAWTFIVTICGVTVYGGSSLFRTSTPLRNFALMTAIVFSGYTCFLIAAYLGATFTEDEVRHAASFYRYSAHTALLAFSALWIAAHICGKKLKDLSVPYTVSIPSLRLMGTATYLLPIIVLSFVLFMHDKWLIPRPHQDLHAIRLLGHKIAQDLPSKSTLAILEPEKDSWDGLFTHIVNLELGLEEARTNRVLYLAGFWNKSPEKTGQYLSVINADKNIKAVLVQKAQHNPLKFHSYDNAQAPLLLYRTAQGWKPFVSQKTVDAAAYSQKFLPKPVGH